MNYRTYEPSSELATFINCYWTLESPAQEKPEKQVIVPDGCMEMIFHYGDLYRQYIENPLEDDAQSIIQPKCFVFGQLTRPLEIEPTGKVGIFSVRFHPNGFLPFATIPIKEMENTAVPFGKVFGKAGSELEKMILRAESTSERIHRVEKFLLDRLSNNETIDRIVKSTIDTILEAKGQLSVDELAKQTQINRRQLERKFSSTVGLSPKQLSKTIRLQSTIRMLLNKKFTSLTALAYENDYYDQAHFIKDFKELTGFTPKQFYGVNLEMSSLFYAKD